MSRSRSDKMHPARFADIVATLGQFGPVLLPTESEAPVITPDLRSVVFQWLAEIRAADELEAVGVKPRSRALLYGPPGCGKTTLAHHIAARVGLPMLIVQSNMLISSYLGRTGQNMRSLFAVSEAVDPQPILFFDELDALAMSRQNEGTAAGAERSNIVIALLAELDRWPGMLFAATNRADVIDPAIWRRFQMQIKIGLPDEECRFAIWRRYLAPYAVADGTVDLLALATEGATPALIREVAEQAKRDLVLGERLSLPTDLSAVLARATHSITPAPELTPPTLWRNFSSWRGDLDAAPWPPPPPDIAKA